MADQTNPCHTCFFYCHASGNCGATDMKATDARESRDLALCGEEGYYYQPKLEPLMQPWQWAVVAGFVFLAIAGGMLQAFGIPGFCP